MSESKLDKFLPREDLNPVCETCKGMHKTSHHNESLLGKTEMMNLVCEICNGKHQTSHHDEYEIERKELLNLVCEICSGPHKTSRHDFVLDKTNEVK